MMPSEDEDFDAAIRPVKPRKPRTRRTPPEATAPGPVAVETTPEPVEAEVPAPKTVAVTFDESVNEEVTPVEEEPAYETPEIVEPHFDAPLDEAREETASEPEAPVAEPVAAVPEASKAPQAPKVRKSRAYGHLVLELILVLALAGLGYYAWHTGQQRDLAQQKYDALYANPQAAVQKQTDDLLAAVGALMKLPSGEVPTIANVSDAAQARQQSAFFNDAQNGDKVLMYVKAGEAILYRPSTNKIILVAPLTTGANGTATPAKP